MPQDDEADRVFDVSKPNKVSPTPTSKPIIVGHHPMISDPMVKDDKDDHSGSLPKSGHKVIQVRTEQVKHKEEEGHKEATEPEAPPEPVEPKEPSNDVSPTLAPATTPVTAQPLHPESVTAVAAPSGTAEKPGGSYANGDLNLTSLDDLIGHEHHSHEHNSESHHEATNVGATAPAHLSSGKKSGKLVWLLILLLILVAGYLAIDSRLIKTSINLPFHVFKQPTPTSQSAGTLAENTSTVATTTPSTGLTTYKLTTSADKTVSFNYPTIWGTPTETTDPGFTSRSTTAKSDGTYAYLVNFSTNKDVQIVLTSGKYLPPVRTALYYDYLQWCVGTNDGKFYKSTLHFNSSGGVDTPSTTTCDQGPLTDATKLDAATIVQLKTNNPDGSLLGDLYTDNLDDELNLPVLRVKDAAMTNSVAIKALLASLKLIDNQSTATSQ